MSLEIRCPVCDCHLGEIPSKVEGITHRYCEECGRAAREAIEQDAEEQDAIESIKEALRRGFNIDPSIGDE